jgi:hypothetical protein
MVAWVGVGAPTWRDVRGASTASSLKMSRQLLASAAPPPDGDALAERGSSPSGRLLPKRSGTKVAFQSGVRAHSSGKGGDVRGGPVGGCARVVGAMTTAFQCLGSRVETRRSHIKQ